MDNAYFDIFSLYPRPVLWKLLMENSARYRGFSIRNKDLITI